jgi:predicted nucleic acid-binding protein
MVLVDTSVWSVALRRAPDHLNEQQRRIVDHWVGLVSEGRAAMIGPIRQEVLSGIRQTSDCGLLRASLMAFDDLQLMREDYEEAARFFNLCRSHGLTGTAIDLLICAVAQRVKAPIFTTDDDFQRYAQHIRIHLYERRVAFAKS